MANVEFERKLGLALASAAAVSLPVTAEAMVVIKTDPVSVRMDAPEGFKAWDVDGDGNAEFHLINRSSEGVQFLSISSFGLDGRGFIGPATDKAGAQEISKGAMVGPTLTTGYWGLSDALRQVAAHTVTFSEPGLGLSWLTRTDTPVLIGFRFGNGVRPQYGWASVLVDFDGGQTLLSIQQWGYETDPGQAVSAGSVDAPGSAAAGLTLLGLGAAGVRTWRARKEATANC